MKVNAHSILPFVFLLLFTGQLVADEYQSIFDGKSLVGWRAPNMSYWSVRDGAITAESTADNPCTANQFLVWQGGEVADFELKLKFRLTGNLGNSGIQFRSVISPERGGIGYQADILPSGAWCGALCDEYTGRKTLLATNGQKTIIDASGKRTTSSLGPPVKLKEDGEWNEYHITALGHHIILRINGQKSAEVIDYETGHYDSRGILALQLRSGPPMKVQFKDIRLKHLGTQETNQTGWREFIGQWAIGVSKTSGGSRFVMTLNEDFSARKSHVPSSTGKWEYVNGEARVVWSEGWRDIIRPEGGKHRKIAFRPGTDFDSAPDNTESAEKMIKSTNRLRVGWARADITPDKSVPLVGFHAKRMSKGVKDRIMATALALESVKPNGEVADQAILVSCDLISIRKTTQADVRRLLTGRLGDFDSDKVLLNATHTHQAPQQQTGGAKGKYALTAEEKAKGCMTGDDYRKFLAERVVQAAVEAWKNRKSGGMSWALDQAVVGFNRRFVYTDGVARMLSQVNTPAFDRIEGVEDHGLLLLYFWDMQDELTGLVINVASPAQSDQGGNLISADFWHDVREEIAARYSKDVFVLSQCGAAGDMYTMGKFRHRAESAMAQRKGITWRREIARRIADGAERAMPTARKHIERSPVFKHTVARINIPEKDPPALPFSEVDSVKLAEFHILRLGDIAVATNPFELFMDYGIRIQARSAALLTFAVQLSCGHSEYVPTTRAVRGGGYSAEQYLVGPEGGRVLVDESVNRINALWP
ncbi:MAG: 3-keto-disaccharide hydrolase [Planctomycetota bacterium]|jgi:hypothetical protein